jgi:hypothetical protein
VGQPFYSRNESELAISREHARVYALQPRRERCKLCDHALPDAPDFQKMGVGYAFCPACGHLNGQHQDTPEFVAAVHSGDWYAAGYRSVDAEAYAFRRDRIYRPKVDFLLEALAQAGEDPRALAYLDVGAGAGYMGAAMAEAGLARVAGWEPAEALVSIARAHAPAAGVTPVDFAGTTGQAASASADVITLIGVLEHVPDPRGLMSALVANPRVKYMLLCMPLFGLCNYLEMVFPGAYPRHLGSDHTHLFTPSSIEAMQREWGLERLAEWWFGSDMLDLYRDVGVTLEQAPETAGMAVRWRTAMGPLIDGMQIAIDRREVCSECHMVFRVVRP